MAKPLAQVEAAGVDFCETNNSAGGHIAGIRMAGELHIVVLHGCQGGCLNRDVVTINDHHCGGGVASVAAECSLSFFTDPVARF